LAELVVLGIPEELPKADPPPSGNPEELPIEPDGFAPLPPLGAPAAAPVAPPVEPELAPAELAATAAQTGFGVRKKNKLKTSAVQRKNMWFPPLVFYCAVLRIKMPF
jgi:hypothetical protein